MDTVTGFAVASLLIVASTIITFAVQQWRYERYIIRRRLRGD